MQIRTNTFGNNNQIPPRYFGNVNPPFDIIDVPQQAQSLALVMHDPDAVSGDYIHWTLWDIDPKTTVILEGSVPIGATEGPNTSGNPGYTGPKPPAGSGTHHYTFELFALDTMLDLLPLTPPDDLIKAINQHTIAHAIYVGVVHA